MNTELVDADVVRRRAKDYSNGLTSLREFEAWLAPIAWGLSDDADGALFDLVMSLQLRIAEYTSGAWTEAELLELVHDIAGGSTR